MRHEERLREQVPSERLGLLAAVQVQVLQEAVHGAHRLNHGKDKIYVLLKKELQKRITKKVKLKEEVS